MRYVVLLLLVLVVLGRGAVAQEAAEQGIRYDVRFEGLDEAKELADLVRDSSALLSRRDDLPPSRAALQRRAQSDVQRFVTAAHSLGYYDADFAADIRSEGDAGQLTVVITGDPGQVYRIASVEIRSTDDASPALGVEVPRQRLELKIGEPARAAQVVSAEAAVVRVLHERGHPLATAGDRTVLIDRETKEMRITFRIDPGPAARFGPVRIEGGESIDPAFVLRRLPWQYGETADVRKVEEGRRILGATGLFDSAGIQFGDAVDAEGLLPVIVTLDERPPRSIGAGVSLSTSEGFAVSAFWTHRNLFGGAERFDIKGQLGTIESSLTSELRVPDVFLTDQDFVFDAGLIQETTEGYDSQKATIGGRFERRVTDILSVDYGVVFERGRVEDDGEEDQYTLIGLPVGATIDTSDDLLNPTRGSRSSVRFTPYLETLGSSLGFYSVSARHAHYIALDQEKDFVLAGRAAIGSMVGASTSNIPADKRFYSGGSGSVRGYGYQEVGPLDAKEEPVGGRSVFEIGAELRWRVYGDFGIVPFIDGGQVYNDETPDFSQELQWAAGLGFRYFTPIGPVRADIAFPLNPRNSDDRFQVYFSLGQAF